VTGFPEMLDGRVKTLHPKIHGGILARRDKPEHLAQLKAQGIEPIDLVVISLYPFEQTVAKPGTTLAEAIEQIDIGGPTLIRAAAKNWEWVAVLVDASQYGEVLDELKRSDCKLSDETRYRLAREAFRRTAQYDAAIAAYLRSPEAATRPAAEALAREIAALDHVYAEPGRRSGAGGAHYRARRAALLGRLIEAQAVEDRNAAT